jgi:Nucleoside 2-deoxyribosyltransferase like
MELLFPPMPLPEQKTKPWIFLGGSIEMGKAEDWQSYLSQRLSRHEVLFLNPRRKDWDSSWEAVAENPLFHEQVSWELNGLEKADWVLMNFVPETMSPISLLELGLRAQSGKLWVCCPQGFWRKGNVDVVCQRYEIPLYADFELFIQDLDKLFSAMFPRI